MASAGGVAYARTLYSRIEAFSAYLGQISNDVAAVESPAARALEAFQLFAKHVSAQARVLAETDSDLERALRPTMVNLRRVEMLADQLFGRGRASEVPRSLDYFVEKELEALGLSDYDPVLVFGSPQNFETFIEDLREWMFELLDQVPDLPTYDRKLALVALPYLEGTRSLWQPVTLGHELAHLLDADSGFVSELPFASWLGEETEAVQRLAAASGSSLSVFDELEQTLEQWCSEVFCDLYTIRRFGPAGFSSMAEFLCSINALDSVSETHPPARLRIECMGRFLEEAGSSLQEVSGPWLEFGEQPEIAVEDLRADLLSRVIRKHFEEVAVASRRVPTNDYDAQQREPVVEELSQSYSRLIPALEIGNGDNLVDIKLADILNAGWLARARLGASEELPLGEKILELDRIVAKALDNFTFVQMWAVAGGDGESPFVELEASGNVLSTEVPAGVLPSGEIVRRMKAGLDLLKDHEYDALVVTPRVTSVCEGTTLDIRLGTGFIVFRRSATTSFDVLLKEQDPRQMQERVEKPWGGRFVLHPYELVLAATLEFFAFPADLSGSVDTRSSYGRLGLLSATASQVHPFFRGCLTLELENRGSVPLVLSPGERIAQLAIQRVSPPAQPPTMPKYSYPTGPQFSRIEHDPDVSRLVGMRHRHRRPRT